MYEMQGTSPGLATSGQPVAWPSRRGHAARQSQEPALGSGRPAPPTSRSHPRAVPVSNGESISTSSAQGSARPARHLFAAFLLSTRCPQDIAGYPHSAAVFHRILHKSSTGYQALRGGTLSCWRVCYVLFILPSLFASLFPQENGGDNPAKFGWPFRRTGYHSRRTGRAARGVTARGTLRLPPRATMRMSPAG